MCSCRITPLPGKQLCDAVLSRRMSIEYIFGILQGENSYDVEVGRGCIANKRRYSGADMWAVSGYTR